MKNVRDALDYATVGTHQMLNEDTSTSSSLHTTTSHINIRPLSPDKMTNSAEYWRRKFQQTPSSHGNHLRRRTTHTHVTHRECVAQKFCDHKLHRLVVPGAKTTSFTGQ
jgi:hypothetical protein